MNKKDRDHEETPVAPSKCIFCVEGEWGEDADDRTSVWPILQLIESARDVRCVHRRVLTRVEMDARFKQFGASSARIGYFAFHGAARWIGNADEGLSLMEFGEVLSGACADKILHFSACGVLRGSEDQLKELLTVTGASAVVGYTRKVDWFLSATMDLLVLEAFLDYQRPHAAANKIAERASGLSDELGLRIVRR